MNFVSLTDPTDKVSFREAIYSGVARDGQGLYMPETIPELSEDELDQLDPQDPIGIGKTMLRPYTYESMSEADLDSIVTKATSFDIPIREVGDKRVLELFHGPTMAFKDVAAAYLGALISHFNRETGDHSNILVATSGDTGGAIAHGFADMPGVDVVVAYPKGRVSALQQDQLRRVAENVHPIEIDGSFNDCLDLTESAYKDQELREGLNLTTANSINVGRLLPQTTYYARIHAEMPDQEKRVVVPTGNLGNLTAGILARAMGVPLESFIAANNINNSVSRYIATGHYSPKQQSEITMSTAMDINEPRNAPRFFHLFNNDLWSVRQVVDHATVTDKDTASKIRAVHSKYGYVLDPHTAVAWVASDRRPARPGVQDVIVSTASPAKFAREIHERTGVVVDDYEERQRLLVRPERHTELENSPEAFREFLEDRLSR